MAGFEGVSRGNKRAVSKKGGFGECALVPALLPGNIQMYPRSGFWYWRNTLNVPSFRFLVPGNIRRNHPFGNHPFANPRVFCIFSFSLVARRFGNGPKTLSKSTVSPSSVSFLGLTDFRGQSSVSSFQPVICVQKRTHRVFRSTHRVCHRTQ